MRIRASVIGSLTVGIAGLSGCVDTTERAARQNSALITAGYSQAVVECGDRFRSELKAAPQTTPGVPLAINLTVGIAMKRTMERRAERRFRACLAPHGVTGEELLPIIDAANQGQAIPVGAARSGSAGQTAMPAARPSACSPGGNVISGGAGYCTR